jgi:Flp pilus assembly protein TadD
MYLGRALHLNYDPVGAQAALKAAQDASPGEVEPQLALAEVLEENQKMAEAEAILRTAHEKAPDHPVITYRLAKLLLATGRAPEGTTMMEAAFNDARYDPGLGFVGLGYGRLLESTRKSKEAESVYRQVQRVDPNNALAYYYLAGFYMRQRRVQDAQINLNRGLEIPNLPAATVEAFRSLQAQLAERAAGEEDRDPPAEDDEAEEKGKPKKKKK